jgi:hypothetical protein
MPSDKPGPEQVEERSVHRRVGELVRIIGQERARVDLIRTAIADFDKLPGRIFRYGKPRNKADKKAVQSLVSALKRVETALAQNRQILARVGGPLHGPDKDAFQKWAAKLESFRKQLEQLEAFAGWKLVPRPHTGDVKRKAVRAAAELLKAHDALRRPNGRLREEAVCEAAAVLCGLHPTEWDGFASQYRVYREQVSAKPDHK